MKTITIIISWERDAPNIPPTHPVLQCSRVPLKWPTAWHTTQPQQELKSKHLPWRLVPTVVMDISIHGELCALSAREPHWIVGCIPRWMPCWRAAVTAVQLWYATPYWRMALLGESSWVTLLVVDWRMFLLYNPFCFLLHSHYLDDKIWFITIKMNEGRVVATCRDRQSSILKTH